MQRPRSGLRSDMIGETISHYRVVEKLGQGGMGVVYKAEDLALDRPVALKFLAPRLATDEDSRKRFIRETKAAATLDHPNICTVYEIAEAQSQIFIAMAYEGQSLEQLARRGPLEIDEAVELALQVGQALAAAHHKGITHRDIKPSNILVAESSSGKERQAKLVDFGLAQFEGSSTITGSDPSVGTVAYMSPEQISRLLLHRRTPSLWLKAHKQVDQRTDIWALGVVLYRLVTGRLPFRGEYDATIMYAVLNKDPEPLSAVRPGVPSELERIVSKALAKDPDERYQRMDEMLADLKVGRLDGERKASGAEEIAAPAWARVKSIFLEVCDLKPELRQQRLEELCGGNRALRREVEQWLEHDSPASIFDHPEEEDSASWNDTGEIADPYIGRTIQSYKLLAVVGRGGMGRVYRAEDIRLKRAVAVKFLSPRLVRDERQKKRFLREAQAMAALDHPSICPVYDVGEVDGRPYIVTAFIAGETLAEPIRAGGLSVDAALDYAIQIGEGLEAAHELGILHRDMKPGNVILARSGEGKRRAKIIDFGLSQIRGESELSEPGQLIGTAAYIAPELLQGRPADAREDVWSLGVMLYEMLSGRQPFEAENLERLFYAICHDEPEPLTAASGEIPENAGRVVAKALQKDPEQRYGSVGDLLDDLRDLKRGVSPRGIAVRDPERAPASLTSPLSSLETNRLGASLREAVGSRRSERWSVPARQWIRFGGLAAAAIAAVLLLVSRWATEFAPTPLEPRSPRVAVLQFQGPPDDPVAELKGRAMTDSIVAELTQITNVDVAFPPTPSGFDPGGPIDADVAKEINADYLVTGTFTNGSERSNAWIRLTEIDSGSVLLARSLEFPPTSLRQVQQEMAEAVANRVSEALESQRIQPASDSKAREAGEHYLRGYYFTLHFQQTFQRASLDSAQRYLQRALELEPDFPDARARLAMLELYAAYPWGKESPRHLDEGEKLARTVLIRNPQHVIALAAQARAALYRQHPRIALDHAQRAVNLDPLNADALNQLADVYEALGLFESAEEVYRRCLLTDPVVMYPYILGALPLVRLGEYAEAISRARSFARIDPTSIHIIGIEAYALVRQGELAAAEATLRSNRATLMERFEDDSDLAFRLSYLEYALALAELRQGRPGLGREVVRKHGALGPRSLDDLILLTVGLGMTREAIQNLEASHYYRNYRYLVTEPGLKPLYREPGFERLLVQTYQQWREILAEFGHALPVQPPVLPTPNEFLQSLAPSGGGRGAEVRSNVASASWPPS